LKVWVTGVAGFLGGHLARAMAFDGHEVWGNDNLVGGSLENLPKEVGFVPTDCRYQREMRHQFDMVKPEVLFHCAATAHEGLSTFSPAHICDNVFQASVATFSAAIAAGLKRIVFTSSMARYGKGGNLIIEDPVEYNLWRTPGRTPMIFSPLSPPFNEAEPAIPVDPYGISKMAAEQVLKVLCDTHGVQHRIAVPHNIIGVGQCYTDPFRNVVSIFLNRLKQGKPGIIYGYGTQKRCFSPVQDIIPCLMKLGTDDKLANGGVWNLGPDNGEITIAELYAKCCDAVGVHLDPVHAAARPNEVHAAYCTATKARAELGFESRVGLEACLAEMAAAIPAGGKPFNYTNHPLEIITDRMPAVWKERGM
jgi:UDP-glucose 4-epimerase